MKISAIVAMSENGVIGKQNQLPWHLPADLQHFKRITMGYPILMGRKTFQSIGRPLPGRSNIVITRDMDFVAPGCIVANSIDTALSAVAYSKKIFIIGGSALFEQMMAKINILYLTLIHAEIEGDTFFPTLNWQEWEELSREDFSADDKNNYAYSFLKYRRK